MAKCGIDKFDRLPGRVGWEDVDMMRFSLFDIKKKIEYWKTQEKQLTEKLDFIARENKKKR